MKAILVLILVLTGVCLLALTKESKQPLGPLEQEVAVTRPAFENAPLSENEYIALRCVSLKEWAHFTENTGYRSYRERQGAHPTWKEGKEGPALWLTPADGREYCRWLEARAGEEISGFLTYRLPTIEELRRVKSDDQWEWTSDRGRDRRYSRAFNGALESDRLEASLSGPAGLPAGIRVVWQIHPR